MEAKEVKGKLSKTQIEDLADEIYQLLKKHDMWSDTFIYFNGCRIGNKDAEGHYHYNGKVYMEPDMDPRTYFEYVNPDHILSMSFEGPVYHMLNYDEYPSVRKKFDAIFKKYGLYYELGNAWNLSCYYI